MASGHSQVKRALIALPILLPAVSRDAQLPANYVAGPLVELNDNGAWSWFMDERVIVDRGKLIVAPVRSLGNFEATQNEPDWGTDEECLNYLAQKNNCDNSKSKELAECLFIPGPA